MVMGMPVIVDIAEASAGPAAIDAIFGHFTAIDRRFSPYRPDSEVSRINRGEIARAQYSAEMNMVLALAAETKALTSGYFDVWRPDGRLDPSGMVKGWAIFLAADILRVSGFRNFYINAGGDIEVSGQSSHGGPWRIGLEDPFDRTRIVKILELTDCGIATSGNYIRGDHIYDPIHPARVLTDIVSLTVVAPNVYEADRFATAAFAMGLAGMNFLEARSGLEAYMIDRRGIATLTSDFQKFVAHDRRH